VDTEGGGKAEERGVPILSAEERMYRGRLHDVPDDRFERVVEALRNRQSIRSIARGLVEEGYLAYLNVTSVRVYLTKIRDAMGLPGCVEQAEEVDKVAKEDEADELIEGQPAFKRLRWLARIQQARVRKALRFEGQMAGMILPMASSEIKLLSDLLDKELEVALKTGEVKTVPQAVTLEAPDVPVLDPAEAFRVVNAWRRVEALLAANATTDKELNAHTIDVSPGAVGTRATSADGGVDGGGSGPVGAPLPGPEAPGPVGPGPGADGEHGRT
jgi:hypothetical protein